MDYIGGLSTSFSWIKSVYLIEWAQITQVSNKLALKKLKNSLESIGMKHNTQNRIFAFEGENAN